MSNLLIEPAAKLCDVMRVVYDQKVANEILVLDADTVAIVADLDGVDYVMSFIRLPRQRPRPAEEGGAA